MKDNKRFTTLRLHVLAVFLVSIVVTGCKTTGNIAGGTPVYYSFDNAVFEGSRSGCRITGILRNTSGRNLPYLTLLFLALDENRTTLGQANIRYASTVPGGQAYPSPTVGFERFSGRGMGFGCSNIAEIQASIIY